MQVARAGDDSRAAGQPTPGQTLAPAAAVAAASVAVQLFELLVERDPTGCGSVRQRPESEARRALAAVTFRSCGRAAGQHEIAERER